MKIVIIDNYDSFTYNLSHLVKELGAEVSVFRNDQFTMNQLEPYDKIILSPGPGIPSEAGLLPDVIKAYAGRKPILGVCLGHQAIGGLPTEFEVGRYHSWVVSDQGLPSCLQVTSRSPEGHIMSLRHKQWVRPADNLYSPYGTYTGPVFAKDIYGQDLKVRLSEQGLRVPCPKRGKSFKLLCKFKGGIVYGHCDIHYDLFGEIILTEP